MDRNELDAMLKAKWNGMKGVLNNGDITGAVNYFAYETRERYTEIFTALADQLGAIAQEMGEIEPVYFPANGAKYAIHRTENIQGTDYVITYFIYFMVDMDGIWRILKF